MTTETQATDPAQATPRPFNAVKAFADSVLAMLDERIKTVDRGTHPFNDYFGDKPEAIVAAKAQASELREVRTQVRILGDRALVDLMKFKPAIPAPEGAQELPAVIERPNCGSTLHRADLTAQSDWSGAGAFIQHAQNAAGSAGADGHWLDEFLAWYKPADWMGEHRAAAVFLGSKIAALAAPAPQAPAIPDGWTALRMERTPGHPETVAYGPAADMEQLRATLDAYYTGLRAEQYRASLPVVEAGAIAAPQAAPASHAEFALRALVAAGHINQDTADEAMRIAERAHCIPAPQDQGAHQ